MSRPVPLPAALEIAAWLAEHGWGEARLEPLAGDVGHRLYQRATLGDGTSVVLVVHPAQLREACRRFVATGKLLAGCGVRVPEVLAADCDAGLMVVEDLGAATLEEWSAGRGWDEIARRFRRALEAARRVAGLDPRQVAPLSPPLDAALLGRELRLAQEHFLEPRGLVEGVSARRAEAAFAALAEAIARQPRVPCHRDFMVRNLMPWDDGVAVLDHQDLRLGPPLYDLASLLNDSLFPPAELEAELVAGWCGGDGSQRQEGRWTEYHRVAAQRTLKACGSYAMAAAEGKDFHLKRMAPTFSRALDHLARVPETEDLARDLAAAWEAGKGAMLSP